MRRIVAVIALAMMLSQAALAQSAKDVINAATKAMGIEALDSITYYGVGATFNLGQNNNASAPWPRVNANDYVPRSISRKVYRARRG